MAAPATVISKKAKQRPTETATIGAAIAAFLVSHGVNMTPADTALLILAVGAVAPVVTALVAKWRTRAGV